MKAAVKQSETLYEVEKLRKDFPILSQKSHGKPLVYLDNAASTQKPAAVIDRLTKFYSEEYANIHRGVYSLSEKATDAFEKVRTQVVEFLNARSEKEIVFTGGTTASINLVAAAYGRKFINKGDEVVVSAMEHHSNIVPWQLLCEERGANLRVIPMNEKGELIVDAAKRMMNPRVRFVSLGHISNALGTVNPVHDIIEMAHGVGAKVMIDGAQAVAHQEVDVAELDCDFYAFSSHKLYGPTGVGVLYGKEELLEAMPPYQGGGDMIRTVSFEKTTFNTLPHKFEAGTPHIAGVIGLGAAIGYVSTVGLEAIANHEEGLLHLATERLASIAGVKLVGTAGKKASIISFTLEGIHPHDIGTILDQQGVAIRAGHHCAQPVMTFFGIPATARASFGLYNTRQEIDQLVAALGEVRKVFA